MTACQISDDRRIAFAIGGEAALDDHVAGCDACQAFLAELWSDELTVDLTEPIMTAVRLEQFLLDAAREAGGALARLVEAIMVYGLGQPPDSEPEEQQQQ